MIKVLNSVNIDEIERCSKDYHFAVISNIFSNFDNKSKDLFLQIFNNKNITLDITDYFILDALCMFIIYKLLFTNCKITVYKQSNWKYIRDRIEYLISKITLPYVLIVNRSDMISFSHGSSIVFINDEKLIYYNYLKDRQNILIKQNTECENANINVYVNTINI